MKKAKKLSSTRANTDHCINKPAATAASLANTLSPILKIDSGLGPMNRIPAFTIASAKSPLSDRNPYPGWIASTLESCNIHSHLAHKSNINLKLFRDPQICDCLIMITVTPALIMQLRNQLTHKCNCAVYDPTKIFRSLVTNNYNYILTLL